MAKVHFSARETPSFSTESLTGLKTQQSHTKENIFHGV